jgi:hypothetical protein
MIGRLLFRNQIRLQRCFHDKIDPSQISTRPLKISALSRDTRKRNYNMEEHQGFSQKVVEAQNQRDLIAELQEKQIVPRQRRRLYDKPKYDLDISE